MVLENWRKGTEVPYVMSRVVDEEWIRPDHLTTGWSECFVFVSVLGDRKDV